MGKTERALPDGVNILKDTRQETCEDEDKPKYVVAHYQNDAIVWFRGTRVYSFADLRIDLTFAEEKLLNGYYHGGFLAGTRAALKEIKPYRVGKDKITKT
jgi:hypothetical protein